MAKKVTELFVEVLTAAGVERIYGVAVSEAQVQMLKGGVKGPANLVVSPTLWKFLNHCTAGGTLRSVIESQISGHVSTPSM
jgi:hypothetical protein